MNSISPILNISQEQALSVTYQAVDLNLNSVNELNKGNLSLFLNLSIFSFYLWDVPRQSI